MYTLSFDSDGRLKTHRIGSDTRTLTYDAAGNPASDGTTTFTWNAAGKLSTTVNNAKTHTYKTNALDQRVSKNGPLSSKFFFFYDPAGQLIGERMGTGRELRILSMNCMYFLICNQNS